MPFMESPARGHSPAAVAAVYPSVRDSLRRSTSEAHARLDKSLGRFNLQNLDGYRRFLEINAAALLPLEAALENAGAEQVIPDWRARSRRNAILKDLNAVDGKARPLDTSLAFNRSQILGAVYVLEGSRLGAKFLLRTIEASPDMHIANASAYLRHGVKERLWQSFLVILEREAMHTDRDEAIEGARQAFDLFIQAAA